MNRSNTESGDNNSLIWAFIAVIFGWEETFIEAAMDIPRLAVMHPPDRIPEHRWPDPVESAIVSYIISKPPGGSILSSLEDEIKACRTKFD
jgi:hypothetical protein